MTGATAVAVVGVHVTRQARLMADRESMELTVEAIVGALDDAGLDRHDVDGMAVDWPGPGGSPLDPCSNWAKLIGPLAWVGEGVLDCAGARGVLNAAAAIQSGLCETVVVGGGQAGTGPVKRGYSVVEGGSSVGAGGNTEFADSWGSYVPPQFALIAQRHMHEFGTTPEQLAAAAATIRNNGHRNPEAVMFGRGPYTVDDVLASRLIASPFHLLDCCIMNQGGCAVVLTTLDRARDLRQPPIVILGGGMEYHQGAYANPPIFREVGMLGQHAAQRAFDRAGISATDLDILSLYDPTSFEIIRQLEVLGLCKQGEGGPMVESGAIDPNGTFPVNPDGGLLSHSWIGTQQETLRIIECVRQLRGGCGDRQVDGAEIGVATNAAAGAQHYELIVLGQS